jgi:exodeoxyribonuclease VII large subunit
MSEEPSKFSLLALNRMIKEGIQQILPGNIWVIAEISDCNTNQSGHCYLELIEKEEGSEKIIAKARGTIWSFTFRILKPYFESTTGQRFSSGLKVLIQASVEFHELYGFSLNIKDIDPSYTVGDLARRKQEIINRLINEGVFELNKELELAQPLQRIAVISSETAAGYGDFKNQLKNNSRGFKFYTALFKAFMQGDDTERSVIQALEKIYEYQKYFDVVVIIRGGGSQAELNYFNNYNIAFHITQFPLPIFSGIGHERDQTITDLVAHTSLKTPTAVAEHIIAIMEDNAQYMEELEGQVIQYSNDFIQDSKTQIELLSRTLRTQVKWSITNAVNQYSMLFAMFQQKLKTVLPSRKTTIDRFDNLLKATLKYKLFQLRSQIHHFEQVISPASKMFLKSEKHKLNAVDALIKVLDPINILKRGYSITYLNGRIVKYREEIKPNDIIETQLNNGTIKSKVTQE